jgi:Amidases related to nicotinamidase
METNTIDTALLVMDMQMGILQNAPIASVLLQPVTKAIHYARSKKIPVIYVRVGFRQGAPEISNNNKVFSNSGRNYAAIDMEAFMKIHPNVAPQADEIIVTKRRFSAFTGSDLEVVLRSKNIRHIVLTGISTSGVVLSTLREAADKDFQITVLADACGDADEEVHRVLTTKIFPRQATVITTGEWSM